MEAAENNTVLNCGCTLVYSSLWYFLYIVQYFGVLAVLYCTLICCLFHPVLYCTVLYCDVFWCTLQNIEYLSDLVFNQCLVYTMQCSFRHALLQNVIIPFKISPIEDTESLDVFGQQNQYHLFMSCVNKHISCVMCYISHVNCKM